MKIKIIIAAITAAFILQSGNSLIAGEAKGFLIYTDHPSTYVEACEFSFLDSTKPAYYTIVRADGRRLQINPGGLWVVVDYPPEIPGPEVLDTATVNLQTIHDLISQYPQFKSQLLAAQQKWGNALQFAKQVAAQQPTPKSQVKITLTVDGIVYHNVTLSSTDSDVAGIVHSDGVASIPIEKLTKEQIIALNTTSSSVSIDPDLPEKRLAAMAAEKKQAEEQKQQEEAEAQKRLAAEKEKLEADNKLPSAPAQEATSNQDTAAHVPATTVSQNNSNLALDSSAKNDDSAAAVGGVMAGMLDGVNFARQYGRSPTKDEIVIYFQNKYVTLQQFVIQQHSAKYWHQFKIMHQEYVKAFEQGCNDYLTGNIPAF